jgi:hypothetical protein
VVIKQTQPTDDADSSVFEIFNRLNTGGVNLRPQEIRASMFHSDFFAMLERVNLNAEWRRLLRLSEPDLHSKDIEVLLRAVALLLMGGNYHEPMSKFLNVFAKSARTMDARSIAYLEELLIAFFVSTAQLPDEAFLSISRRFNIGVFEAVFRAVCADAADARTLAVWQITAEKLDALKADGQFIEATRFGIGRATHVLTRFQRARAILAP